MVDSKVYKFVLAGLEKIFNETPSYYDKRNHVSIGKQILNQSSFHPYFIHMFESDDNSRYWRARVSNIFMSELDKEDGLRPSDFWKEKFVPYSSPEYIKSSSFGFLSGNYPWIDLGIRLNDNLKTFEIFEVLYSLVLDRNWIDNRYKKILDRLVEESPVSLKLFIESNVFKKGKLGMPKPVVRGDLYAEYIKAGFLTKKTARKIRSDSSAEASLAGVQALIYSEKVYDSYDDLLLCFTDSRHEIVVAELANSLPLHLISSLLGTDFSYAKTIIERRMTNGV